jgi:hypothetical protein
MGKSGTRQKPVVMHFFPKVDNHSTVSTEDRRERVQGTTINDPSAPPPQTAKVSST